MSKRHMPGSKWRLRAVNAQGEEFISNETSGKWHFDEVVVDHWLHVEQMSQREYWLKVGDAHIWIDIGEDGFARNVTLTDGIGEVRKDSIRLDCDWRPPKKRAAKKKARKK